jgi:hypothetical protein
VYTQYGMREIPSSGHLWRTTIGCPPAPHGIFETMNGTGGCRPMSPIVDGAPAEINLDFRRNNDFRSWRPATSSGVLKAIDSPSLPVDQ